jgi:HD-GYP domain-containing protein (c-di-GMP phosphodiesterase class II)
MSEPDAIQDESLDLIGVEVEDLIVGRRLDDPIHDSRGVFLLAAGAVITPELKRQLRSHGIDDVQITKSDASRTTAGNPAEFALESELLPELPQTELTRRLDEIVESESFELRTDGAPLRDRQEHRRHEYDDQMRQHLHDQHGSVCRGLGDALRAVVAGETVRAGRIARFAAGYHKHQVNDSDIVLSVALEATGEDALSDQALKTSLISMALGMELDWSEEDVRDVGLIAMVQDWGMELVDPRIRRAPRPLNRHETFELMKHPIYSVDLLARVTAPPKMTTVVAYQVHERIDGSGYPRGREERMIHPFAKTIQVADAYVALTSARPWRDAMMPYAALECLLRQAKRRQVDGRVVRALLQLVSLFPIGSFVSLSDGSVAQVTRRNGDDYTRPLVKRLQDERGRNLRERELCDLAEQGLSIVSALPTPGRSERRFDESALKSFLQPPATERSQRVVHAPV